MTAVVRPTVYTQNFDVRAYGALGNGTHDDTTAITADIAAMPATGGTLFFPAGKYVTSGGFTISVPCRIAGAGMAAEHNDEGAGTTDYLSTITCTSRTAVLFTVTAAMASFDNITLENTAALVPTAGAGIRVTSALIAQRVDYESVYVQGFYDDVSIETGASWTMHGCHLYTPVRYAIRIQNIVNCDAGDWAISDSSFFCSKWAATAAIRIESSGGGKITNCKIVNYATTYRFQYGVDIAFGNGISTMDYLISNCSIEGSSVSGIHAAVAAGGILVGVVITGCEIGLSSLGASGYPIEMSCTNVQAISSVTITGCVLLSPNAGQAISLTNVASVTMTGNRISYPLTNLCSVTGCLSITADTSEGWRTSRSGTDLSITAGSFAVLDAALQIPIWLTGSRHCLVGWTLSYKQTVATGFAAVDVLVDGATYASGGAQYGLLLAGNTVGDHRNLSGTWRSGALTPGTHTFDLVFRIDGSGTAIVNAGTLAPLMFWVQELPAPPSGA